MFVLNFNSLCDGSGGGCSSLEGAPTITRSSPLLILGSRLSGSISSLFVAEASIVDDSTGINDGVLRSIRLLPLPFGGEDVLLAATSEAGAAVDINDEEATEIEDVFAEEFKVICSILVLLI